MKHCHTQFHALAMYVGSPSSRLLSILIRLLFAFLSQHKLRHRAQLYLYTNNDYHLSQAARRKASRVLDSAIAGTQVCSQLF